MRFELSEDQREIKRTAREFLAARYPLEKLRETEGDPHWAEVCELGWPELAIPEEQSGMGLGVVELCVVAEEAGYALAPTPLLSTWAAGLLLAAAGEGERIGGGRRGTVAQWDADGDADPDTSTLAPGERLTGVKIAVPDAAGADLIVVTAEGGRMFAVAGADVSVEPAESLDTTRPLSTVRLDGAPAVELRAPADALTRAWGAIATACAAESVGVAARALDMAVAYAKERKQFGRPIGSYQAISHACAQMLLEVEGARSVAYWAAWALDHDPQAAPHAAACAKAYASDAGRRVTRSALQVHGGIGFTWEHDLHFLLKRAEANAHAYGDARWQREQVAAAVLSP
jgi:alkylation response protein AidB-like acyl-CoA dehydrogenase